LQRKTDRRGLFLFGLALLIIVLDQWSKTWVRANLALNESWMPIAWLDPFVTFTHIHNTGVAFGMLQNRGILFVIVNLVVVAAIIAYYWRIESNSWLLRIALALELGGAIGNLIDRLARGYVTDFVNVRFFAVFNVADSCITVGAILLGIYALFLDRDQPEVAAQAISADQPTQDAD